MKILIVDDDRDDAAQLHDAVIRHSPLADCREVYNGQSATNELQYFFPDFMFIDAVMSPTSGKELLRNSVGRPELARTQFIIISNHLLIEDYSMYTVLGASTVLAKVPGFNALALLVEKILAPAVVDIQIKVFTDDTIVHQQAAALQELLRREVSFEIELNMKNVASNIQFQVSEIELEEINSSLGYPLLRRKGGHWLPNISRSSSHF